MSAIYLQAYFRRSSLFTLSNEAVSNRLSLTGGGVIVSSVWSSLRCVHRGAALVNKEDS